MIPRWSPVRRALVLPGLGPIPQLGRLADLEDLAE
jgi:hypothetical protein